MNETPPPLVLVQWEDAQSIDESAWVENKDHDYKPYLVYQVGFLLSDTEQGLILSQAWNPKAVGARDQIPRGMVRSVVLLEPVKRKRGK